MALTVHSSELWQRERNVGRWVRLVGGGVSCGKERRSEPTVLLFVHGVGSRGVNPSGYLLDEAWPTSSSGLWLERRCVSIPVVRNDV